MQIPRTQNCSRMRCNPPLTLICCVSSTIEPHDPITHRAAMTTIRLFALEGARASDPEVAHWFGRDPRELRAEAHRWFQCMRSQGPDVLELLHDGHPTACVGGFALGYVNAFTNHVNVGFFLGSTLSDPAGVLEGTGRFMRHVKVRPGAVDNNPALEDLIGRAYADLKSRLAQR